MPDKPSVDDVKEARRLILDEVLIDFPFVATADQTHAVAGLITPLVRPLIKGPTPLLSCESPTGGTGKGVLATAIAIIATGYPPELMVEGRDPDEWRKRITSILRISPTIVCIDNVQKHLDPAALAVALTSETWTDRELGFTRQLSFPIRTSWIMTANNPSYSDELGRRIVQCRMDSKLENPEERTNFRHQDLLGRIRAHRGELLWAVLVLIRHWVSEGMPPGAASLGSYEDWARVEGGILQVNKFEDFLGNRDSIKAQVRRSQESIRGLVELWRAEFKDMNVTAGVLFDLAKEHDIMPEARRYGTDRAARTAFANILKTNRDKVFHGCRIHVGEPGHAGLLQYYLEVIPPLNT